VATVICLNGSSAAPRDKGQQEQDEENHEEDLRNPCRSASQTSESEDSGDNRDDEKYYCPLQH
jgi:hypothetical protein